jgi:glycosyltransferase involved in cell wall biosynthesis
MNTAAKVSVLMITYNQEEYIAEAIDSVLAQQTDFRFELVIGEDCSTDGTHAICQAYQQEHPAVVRLLPREKNLGMAANFFSTFAECTGEYLAIVEGDDYWPDPRKLQKQADHLDANPGEALVFARTQAFFQDSDRPGYEIPPPEAAPFTLAGLLKLNYIATCSVMYRRRLVTDLPSWLTRLDMLDWPLHILYAQRGAIGFIDETMARYRIHAGGTFSSRRLADNHKSTLDFYQLMRPHLGPRHDRAIHRSQARTCKALARIGWAERSWTDTIRYALLASIFYARCVAW